MSPVWRPGQKPVAPPPTVTKAGGQMGTSGSKSGHKKAGD